MFNLVKYEFKTIYRAFLSLIAAILILLIIMYFNINSYINLLNTFVSSIVILVILILTFINSIKIFSKYIYDDEGYLLFTLPTDGKAIVMSRLIVGLTINIISLILGALFSLSIAYMTAGEYITFKINFSFAAFVAFRYILWISVFLLIIYFSIALSRVLLKRNKFEKFAAFLITVFICILLGKINQPLNNIIPLSVKVPLTVNISPMVDLGNIYMGQPNLTQDQYFGMGTIFGDIMYSVLLFFGTAYFLDKKVEI